MSTNHELEMLHFRINYLSQLATITNIAVATKNDALVELAGDTIKQVVESINKAI